MQRATTHDFALPGAVVLDSPALTAEFFVYFGSHGKGPNIGFSRAQFESATGKLTRPMFLEEAVAPAYFLLHSDGKRLYTCNSFPGSSVSAYAIDPATAKLTFLNQKPSGGGDPSYVSLDATGRFLMVANYQGGSAAVFALQPDGSIGERTAFVQHAGTRAAPETRTIPDGQTQARAHSIQADPTNRFVLVADLGVDALFVYRFDPMTGMLLPNDPPFASVLPGSGPRHMAFHPNSHDLYVINEMSSSIFRFGWDSTRGVLTPFESVSILPKTFQGPNTGAEILVHPSGKFVYTTSRGHDSVAVFSVQMETGRLIPVQHISTQGETPRNCEFDPTARWLLVTNQDSSSAIVFGIDFNTGRLKPAGPPIPVPSPFCARFLSLENEKSAAAHVQAI